MVARRVINEEYALEPVDFNYQGLKRADELKGLDETDAILDIGCSSGKFVLDAAAALGIKSHIYGLDPDAGLQQFLPDYIDTRRFTFIEGYGEDIPLEDNSVKVTTAHNVIFRARSVGKMLAEMKRVTKPDGLIIISTNSRDHARYRHDFEEMVADLVSIDMHMRIEPPQLPAENCTFEALDQMIKADPGLIAIAETRQRTEAVITRERVGGYVFPILFSANRTNIPDNRRGIWRYTVRKVVEQYIDNELDLAEKDTSRNGNQASFNDIIHRGMIVASNLKTS